MDTPKYFASLYAKNSEAVYLSVSKEWIVCLVTMTASPNSSWETFRALRNSLMRFFNSFTSCKVNCTFNIHH